MSELAERLLKWADLIAPAADHVQWKQNHADLLAAAEIVERATWKPIAEAPRDGTVIIAGKFDWLDGQMDVEPASYSLSEGGWVAWQGQQCEGVVSYDYYTHYRPIPAPPEVKP